MSRPSWVNEEIEFLKQNYIINGIKFCAEKLNRSNSCVSSMAYKVGLKKYISKKWKEKEIKVLKDNYKIKGVDFCSKILNRTRSSILAMAQKMGIKIISPKKLWEEKEILFLKENYFNKGPSFCAKELKIKTKCVQRKAKLLGLKMNQNFEVWSKKDIMFLKENYEKNGGVFCSNYLKKDINKIHNMAYRLHLKVIGGNKASQKRRHESTFKIRNEYVKLLTNPLTPEAIYILGFLWGDGHISEICIKNKNNCNYFQYRTMCHIVKEDFNEIEDIVKRTSCKWKFRDIIPKAKNNQIQKSFRIHSEILYNFLKEHGYKEKSGGKCDKILSIIPENLKYIWWRGYSDADGCFYFNGDLNKNTYAIVSTYDQDWSDIEKLLTKLNCTYYLNKRINKNNGKCSNVSIYNRRSIIKWGNYLYPNGLYDNIGFKRKYIKFKAIKDRFDV